jgi:hypothetical protein
MAPGVAPGFICEETVTTAAAALHPKYWRLVQRLARATQHPGQRGRASHDGAHDDSSAADELYEMLEKDRANPGFESGWEVSAFAHDQACYGLSDCTDPGEYAERLSVALAAPLMHHKFSVQFSPPVSSPTDLALHWDIGGANALAFDHDDQGSGINTLSGIVRTATLGTARSAVPRLLDQVIGAFRALGLSSPAGLGMPPVLFTGDPRPTITAATVRLDGDWAMGEHEEFVLPPAYALRLRSERFALPADLTDLEQGSLRREDLTRALSRRVRSMRTLFGGESPRANDLRNACRLALVADESDDFGVFIALAFSCLEGLLVSDDSKEDTVARLAEAVAFSLGKSFDERNVLRTRVKKLYKTRSAFVHTGKAKQNDGEWMATRSLLFQVLRREIELLPDPGQ